jgi:thiamine biosynthesis lipoprotein
MRFVLNQVLSMASYAPDKPTTPPRRRHRRCRRLVRALAVPAGLAVAIPLTAPAPLAAQFAREAESDVRVLLSREQALEEVFGEYDRVVTVPFRPTADQRAALEASLGRRLYEPRYDILEVRKADRLLGYGVITEERGKYRPITFLVGVTPDNRVLDTAIMVYRESRGGEVARKRFLGQYRGKSSADPIRINRDIISISGATISVRSVNAGVRKVLAVVETWAADRPPTGRAASGR